MSTYWLPIVGFEDCGEVSNTGLIRNKHGKIRKTNVSRGYERVGFYGGQETVFVHRLVARAFCSGFEDGLVVNHKDGNKLNNNADNLEWVTASENVQHAHDIGLCASIRDVTVGKDNYADMVKMREEGHTYRAIGEKYGVEYRTAFAAIKREIERRAEH